MRRYDATTVRHRLPITLCCVVIPSPAPFDSSVTLLLEVSSPSNDRSTQDPPPPADEAWVLRVTLNVCLPFSLDDFGDSLPPEAPYIKSAHPVVPMPNSSRSSSHLRGSLHPKPPPSSRHLVVVISDANGSSSGSSCVVVAPPAAGGQIDDREKAISSDYP